MICNWTQRSIREYRKIIEYLVEEYGAKSAISFVEALEKADSILAKYSEAGFPEPLLADRGIIYRSYIVNKHNKLVYKVSSNKVTIVDIWDMRREPSPHHQRS